MKSSDKKLKKIKFLIIYCLQIQVIIPRKEKYKIFNYLHTKNLGNYSEKGKVWIKN